MNKKKLIALMMCLTMTCASVCVSTACSSDSGTSSSGSSSSEPSSEAPIVVEYKVTFDSVGGSNVSTQTVVEGAKATKPQDPTREGFTFVEWKLEGQTYDFEQAVTSNITLKAVWMKNALATFTVTFDVGEGTPVESKSITEGGTVAEPTSALEGKYIEYWTLNGERYDFSTPVVGDITLVAVWKSGSLTVAYESGSDVLALNATAKLSAITDIDGIVVFESSDETVLTVTQEGLVTAVAAGKATITISVGNVSVSETIYVASAGLKGTDFNKMSWGWNNNPLTTTQEENGYSLAVKFGVGAAGDGYWINLHQTKDYYEKLAAEGYVLTFDLEVTGHSGDDYYGEFNWPLIKVFGKTLEEYGFTSGSGKIMVSMDALVAAYDMQAQFLAGEVKETVAQSNYWFTIDRVNDYARFFNLKITNYEYIVKPKETLSFVNAQDEIVGKNGTLQLDLNGDYVGEEIVWSSSDNTVATVENGVVTGLKGGVVTVTAKVGEESATKKVYVASADLKGSDFNKMSWGWNNNPLTTTEVDNGYSIAVKFNTGAAGDGYWMTLSQNKAYYEKLAAEGYVLTFDLEVTGHSGDNNAGEYNWPLIKVFGKTLEEYGFTSGSGKITVSMDALVAAYDMQAQFLAGEVKDAVAQSNYWFTIDRVNDYARFFNLKITNYEFVKAEV